MIGFEDHKSSVIRRVGYNPMTRHLAVELDSGGIYCYSEVSMPIYHAFRDAESRGRYFTRRIRGQYECVKVTHNNLDNTIIEEVIARGEQEANISAMGTPAVEMPRYGNVYYINDYQHLPRRSAYDVVGTKDHMIAMRAENNRRAKADAKIDQ